MNKDLNVKFDLHYDANLEEIRNGARAAGYVMTADLKEFVRIKYNARLNVSHGSANSITFKDPNSKDLAEFKRRKEINFMWNTLKGKNGIRR